MAGDWIKMRSNLWDDPRVASLCDMTDCGEAQVVGGLYWLWSAADQHSEDGVMPGLTLRSIDRKTGIAGFGAALASVGLIVVGDRFICISQQDDSGFFLYRRGITPTRPLAHVWSEIRARIFKRDDFTCQYCGSRGGRLECDHVVPVSRGGVHSDDNLVTSCFPCNRKKGTKLVGEWRGK